MIHRAVFFEITIFNKEITTEDKSGLSIQQVIKERSYLWAKKTHVKKQLTVKLFKIFFDVPTFNDGKMESATVITGHIYGGQTGKDVSGGDAHDVAEDFEKYIKTGNSTRIQQILREERA